MSSNPTKEFFVGGGTSGSSHAYMAYDRRSVMTETGSDIEIRLDNLVDNPFGLHSKDSAPAIYLARSGQTLPSDMILVKGPENSKPAIQGGVATYRWSGVKILEAGTWHLHVEFDPSHKDSVESKPFFNSKELVVK